VSTEGDGVVMKMVVPVGMVLLGDAVGRGPALVLGPADGRLRLLRRPLADCRALADGAGPELCCRDLLPAAGAGSR